MRILLTLMWLMTTPTTDEVGTPTNEQFEVKQFAPDEEPAPKPVPEPEPEPEPGPEQLPAPEPTPDPLTEPIVIFPTNTITTPTPSPSPDPLDPRTVTILQYDELYVVQSKVELMLRTFGGGEIRVNESPGPKTIPGKFSGGKGVYEVKEFKYPYLYFISAVSSGKVTIDFIPSGLQKRSEAKIMRQVLTIPGAPQPPPDPKPEPTPLPVPPKPDPKPEPIPPTPEPEDTTVEHVHLSIVHDTHNVSMPTAKTLNALYGFESLVTSGSSYLLYDQTTTEKGGTRAIGDIKKAGVAYPAITVRDKATDTLLDTKPLPQTPNDLKVYINSFLKTKL